MATWMLADLNSISFYQTWSVLSSSVNRQSKASITHSDPFLFFFLNTVLIKNLSLTKLVRLPWTLFSTRPRPWFSMSILFLLSLHSSILAKILIGYFSNNLLPLMSPLSNVPLTNSLLLGYKYSLILVFRVDPHFSPLLQYLYFNSFK